MSGKVLKVSSNDLYGNVDERKVVIYACFNHVKYMNKYIIFAFLGEYDKKKLCYGSVHLKEDSLVIFSVNNNVYEYIDKFKNQFLDGNIDSNEYEIINIDNIEKSELISYNDADCDKLLELENIAIKKEEKQTTVVNTSKEKKPVFLYILLVILILLLIGITYLYLRPEDFVIRRKNLVCNKIQYNEELSMEYIENREVLFDGDDEVFKIEVIDSYIFNDLHLYNQFKEDELEKEYFRIDGTFKYNDNDLELKIIYEDTSIITDYDEIKEYLINDGYNCTEGYYEQ